jgi:hypothetical protein
MVAVGRQEGECGSVLDWGGGPVVAVVKGEYHRGPVACGQHDVEAAGRSELERLISCIHGDDVIDVFGVAVSQLPCAADDVGEAGWRRECRNGL